MLSRFALKTKLTALCLALVILSTVLVGVFGLRKLTDLGNLTADIASANIEKQAADSLLNSVKGDRTVVLGVLQKAEDSLRNLAASPNLASWLQARAGNDPVLNRFAAREATAILSGIRAQCQTQQNLLEKTLDRYLAIAVDLFQTRFGTLESSAATQPWTIRDQASGATRDEVLPVMETSAGGLTLLPNSDPAKPTPIVDEIHTLTGVHCTIFQRINPQGDMLRIATTVIGKDGKRAIGTAIMAQGADGQPTPMIAKVLRGEPFVGRAFVVDRWFVTAYAPLKNKAGEIVGTLFVGLPEQENTALLESITRTRLGASGYVYITDSKGSVIHHPDAALIGRHAVTDAHLEGMEEILKTRKDGEILSLETRSGSDDVTIFHTWFPAWDWVICGRTVRREHTAELAAVRFALLRDEMTALAAGTRWKDKDSEKTLFPQVRLLDEKGREVISVRDGQAIDKLEDKGRTAWFAEALAAKPGDLLITRPALAENTGQPEIRYLTPVFAGGAFQGAVVINFDWRALWGRLKESVYGKTGYAYIVDTDGVLLSHPKYGLDNICNIGDPKYGRLAEIVKGPMAKGETGFEKYLFEGIDKYVAFTPLVIGRHTYTIAGNCPTGEFLEAVVKMRNEAQSLVATATRAMGGFALVLALIGGLLGLVFSLSIATPIQGIITGMTEAAHNVSTASGEISRTSQAAAAGASQRA